MRKQRRPAQEYQRWFKIRQKRGLTWSDLAEESGIPLSTLYEWRRRLQKAGRRRAAERFTRVAVVEPQAPMVPLEVELPNGCRIRVPSAFDPAHLRRVVEAISREC